MPHSCTPASRLLFVCCAVLGWTRAPAAVAAASPGTVSAVAPAAASAAAWFSCFDVAAAAVPASAVSSARSMLRERRCKWRALAIVAQREAAQTELEREKALRKSAAMEAELLLPEAAQVARDERFVGGLIILAAYYGNVAAALASNPTSCDLSKLGTQPAVTETAVGDTTVPPPWLDVRVALQYAVANSILRLPARSKHTLRGFAPMQASLSNVIIHATAADPDAAIPPTDCACVSLPLPSQPQCQLWVRYQRGAEVKTVCIGDDEALLLSP